MTDQPFDKRTKESRRQPREPTDHCSIKRNGVKFRNKNRTKVGNLPAFEKLVGCWQHLQESVKFVLSEYLSELLVR